MVIKYKLGSFNTLIIYHRNINLRCQIGICPITS